ncbi:MAG: metal ABC transporter ATP-binding protein [Gemella haemolysans]|uniref:metal ABC transporter ATP-binding protein n=1 Tax=Gemella haemolysans TaxID=1379 RepID=UPI00290991C5|nr:metal ABC transporter ATP-binding protein [Gemella haemolysans]MDU4713474.1 metal ABC transporter ATP-binding protein [Gemella haemolysans]
MIYIENLKVTYNQIPALSNINLEIKGPGITGIIGPNGAGKSTLIKAILNIIPSTGIAKIDNKISKENLDNVAYVEQKINIDYNFPIKVRECVSLGLYSKIGIFKKLKKSDWQKVDDALKLVGLEKFSNRQISELSGGQFQRVLIARCLVQEAKYIFLDEPFVGIDSVSEEIIMETLRNLRDNGHTILIVHHDLRKVHSYFDNVLLLNKEIIAYGNTKDTFTRENLTKAYGTDLFFMGGGEND